MLYCRISVYFIVLLFVSLVVCCLLVFFSLLWTICPYLFSRFDLVFIYIPVWVQVRTWCRTTGLPTGCWQATWACPQPWPSSWSPLPRRHSWTPPCSRNRNRNWIHSAPPSLSPTGIISSLLPHSLPCRHS